MRSDYPSVTGSPCRPPRSYFPLNMDTIEDAVAHAMGAAAEYTERAAMLADLANNLGPAVDEIARLAAISRSFENDPFLDAALDPIREKVAAQLHRHATTFDGGCGEDEIEGGGPGSCM